MHALPLSASFLFLEMAAGGAIVLLLVYRGGEIGRGFTLFTGLLLAAAAAVAIWLRSVFPPTAPLGVDPTLPPVDTLWLGAERVLAGAFLALFAAFLVGVYLKRSALASLLAPLAALLGLGWLWAAALVQAGPQVGGLGAPLALLAGSLALGAALVGLSLGHWYLVTPSLSSAPLVYLTFVALGALGAQTLLLPLLLLLAPGYEAARLDAVLQEQGLFLGVRVVFGLLVPLAVAVMAWRTARIRSLDSATGLLYILAALVLTGEIVARTLFFLTGVAT